MGGLDPKTEIRKQWAWRNSAYPWYKSGIVWHLGRVLVQISEEIAVFGFQATTNIKFVFWLAFCLILGVLGSSVINLNKYSEIAGAVILGLLGIALTAVIFIATITNERQNNKRKHDNDIRSAIRKNKALLNKAVNLFLETPAPESQWQIQSVLRLYILINVDDDQDIPDLRVFLSKVRETFPETTFGLNEPGNIPWLVDDSYSNYDYYIRASLDALLSKSDAVIAQEVKMDVGAVRDTFGYEGEFHSMFALRQLLGRRIQRIVWYSFLALISLAVIVGITKLGVFPELDAARHVIKALVIAGTTGIVVLIFRYYLSLLEFMQTDLFPISTKIPYITPLDGSANDGHGPGSIGQG